MILIDTNALVVLLLGFIDPRIFKWHNTTSIYDEQDHIDLMYVIQSIDKLVVLPNVWTETDNLLNGFTGNYKFQYIDKIKEVIKVTTEKYLETNSATETDCFYELGITDSLLLEHAKKCDLLVTSDSKLSDFANAYGIAVYDLVRNRNKRL